MYENPTGRILRCPECFAKDMDVFLLYEKESNEFYCYKCCFTGNVEIIDQQFKSFVEKKYKDRC
jgi:hypothetical protein